MHLRRPRRLLAAVAVLGVSLGLTALSSTPAAPAALGLKAQPASAAGLLPIPWPLPGSLAPVELPPDVNVPYLHGVNTICPEGARSCYEGLYGDLITKENQLGCNRADMFNDAYITITRHLLDLGTQGFFSPTSTLYHEGTQYGRQYLGQRALYEAGNTAAMVPAWFEAYKAADAHTNTGLGDILMQLAAHILYDNPVRAIEQGEDVLRGPGAMPGSSGRFNHDRVNDGLQESLVPMINHLAAVFDPTIDDANQVLGQVMDPSGLYVAIFGWREISWRTAELLRKARATPEILGGGVNGPLYQTLLAEASANAKATVLAIKAATLATPQQNADREAYCATHFTPLAA